jgi:hypothetical protein
MSLVSVVCCQVEVPAMGRSLVQSSPTECMSLSVIKGNKREVTTKRRKKAIHYIGTAGADWCRCNALT